MAANSLSAIQEYVRCQIASASKMGMPQRSAQWQQMAAREQNGNAPALSAMAVNGRVQAKWEYPSAQRNSSKWPRASKMGMPQRSARWQQRMAAREQNGSAPALSVKAVNGRARAKWDVPWRDGSEWPQRNKQQSKGANSQGL